MAGLSDHPKLILPIGFDDVAEQMAPIREFIEAEAEFDNGARCTVTFITPRRLAQEFAVYMKWGRRFYALPCLILLPEVSVSAAQEVLILLEAEGFFDDFKSSSVR